MGKSAQFPLHVWLPDSMEGPTPISALIHAATMVTAGIFMVARMSPLFELSDTALSFVLVIGSITALFMGFLGVIQNDIKRVVAYSTLSQLGYMTVALGSSAYSVAVFHLMTHAFFKALLFLGAGSVIIGMHHDQDIRNMGGLRKYMPITWITSLLGSLALIGTPFFSGFYSKDSIIEAVQATHLWGSSFAQFSVLAGVFVTAFYSFRMYFLVFHGEERFGKPQHHSHGHDSDAHDEDHDDHHAHGLAPGQKPHESPFVVTFPLIMLAIPSVIIGYLTIGPMLFGDFFKGVIVVGENHKAMEIIGEEFHGAMAMAIHAFTSLPFILAALGVASAYYCYMINQKVPAWFFAKFHAVHTLLDNKYYMDKFNDVVFSGGARLLGNGLWNVGDKGLIDGLVVNGSAKLVGWFSSVVRNLQTGYIYHYAFVMIIGVLATLLYFFPFWHA
jgi:NADH-quinone oxidoreductase subunit L